MYIVITKQIRLSKDVEFFTPKTMKELDSTYQNYFNKIYVESGKFIHGYTEISASELELTITGIWEDEKYVEEFRNDPVIIERFFKARKEYFEKNNILGDVVSTETA